MDVLIDFHSCNLYPVNLYWILGLSNINSYELMFYTPIAFAIGAGGLTVPGAPTFASSTSLAHSKWGIPIKSKLRNNAFFTLLLDIPYKFLVFAQEQSSISLDFLLIELFPQPDARAIHHRFKLH